MCACVYMCTIETIPYVQTRNMYVHQKSDEPTEAQTNRRLEHGQYLGISQSTFLHLTRQTIRRREKVRYWRNSTRNIEASVIETGEILAFFTAARCLLYKRQSSSFVRARCDVAPPNNRNASRIFRALHVSKTEDESTEKAQPVARTFRELVATLKSKPK